MALYSTVQKAKQQPTAINLGGSAQQNLAAQGAAAPQAGNYGGGTANQGQKKQGGLAGALGAGAAPGVGMNWANIQAGTKTEADAGPANAYRGPAQGQDQAFAAWGPQGERQGGGAAAQQGKDRVPFNPPAFPGTGTPPPMNAGGPKSPFAGAQSALQGVAGMMTAPMMGPNAGAQMNLSKALAPGQTATAIQPGQGMSAQPQGGQHVTMAPQAQMSQADRDAYIHDGLNPDDPTIGQGNGGGQGGAQGQESTGSPWGDLQQNVNNLLSDWTSNGGVGGIPAPDPSRWPGGGPSNHPLQDAGYGAGRLAGAFPAGMAQALNEYGKQDLNSYFDNFQDTQNIYNAGQGLLDPASQAAADAAERQQLQTQIASERDDSMRRLQGQAGRGGAMGTGAQTGVMNSALRAQAEGSNKLAQDQYQRMMGRTQLGGSLMSDATRQKYGIMNDAYTSPGQLAALLMQAGPQMLDILNKAPGSTNPLLQFFK